MTCLYFAGSFSPPCNGFLPKLIDFYNELNTEEKLLEIIYVPYDKTEDDYKNQIKSMPWVSLPFKDERIAKY